MKEILSRLSKQHELIARDKFYGITHNGQLNVVKVRKFINEVLTSEERNYAA